MTEHPPHGPLAAATGELKGSIPLKPLEGSCHRPRELLSPSASWVELAGANLPIFLLGSRAPTAQLGATRIRRDFGRHWTPVHLDFIVPDIDAAVARLTGLGATLDRPIQTADYGRMANMADPFGNGFDLIEFSGSGYDAVSR